MKWIATSLMAVSLLIAPAFAAEMTSSQRKPIDKIIELVSKAEPMMQAASEESDPAAAKKKLQPAGTLITRAERERKTFDSRYAAKVGDNAEAAAAINRLEQARANYDALAAGQPLSSQIMPEQREMKAASDSMSMPEQREMKVMSDSMSMPEKREMKAASDSMSMPEQREMKAASDSMSMPEQREMRAASDSMSMPEKREMKAASDSMSMPEQREMKAASDSMSMPEQREMKAMSDSMSTPEQREMKAASNSMSTPQQRQASAATDSGTQPKAKSVPASKRREMGGRSVKVPEAAKRMEAAKNAPPPVSPHADAQKALDDLVALYEDMKPDLEWVREDGLMFEFDENEAAEKMALIERIDGYQDRYQTVIAAFREKFSDDSATQNERAKQWGIDSYHIDGAYGALSTHRAKLAAARDATAVWLVEKANWWIEVGKDRADDEKINDLKRIAKVLDAGSVIAPAHPQLNEMRASMDGKLAAQQKANDDKVAAARWPGRMGGFAGPGDAADLERTVKNYLANDRSWGKSPTRKNKILAVAIKGDWEPAERDIWSQILSWRLPVWVAVTHPNLEKRGMAQVFSLSMVTKMGAPNNTNKKPPFDGPWVGDNFYIKLENLP